MTQVPPDAAQAAEDAVAALYESMTEEAMTTAADALARAIGACPDADALEQLLECPPATLTRPLASPAPDRASPTLRAPHSAALHPRQRRGAAWSASNRLRSFTRFVREYRWKGNVNMEATVEIVPMPCG